jgi:hypothetical protein
MQGRTLSLPILQWYHVPLVRLIGELVVKLRETSGQLPLPPSIILQSTVYLRYKKQDHQKGF